MSAAFQRWKEVHLNAVIKSRRYRFESTVVANFLMLWALPGHVLQER